MDKDTPPTWIIPAVTVHLPDGSTLVKPGKAIQRATVSRVAKLTGVERRTLHALADAGLVRRERPSPAQSFFYPGEIEALLSKTSADPGYWDAVRSQAFLSGKTLRKSSPQ